MELVWNRAVGRPFATLILAHGAGAGMDSAVLEQLAQGLAARGLAVVRFEFPYMAARRLDGKRRPPDPQARLLACWREVYALVRQQVAGPVVLAGKSMGGRMASLLVDELGADALVCFGYPFHPAGKPDTLRVEHLHGLRAPTLIIQGERDALGNRGEVEGYALPARIALHWLTAADHDLKPLKSSGFSHEQHLAAATSAVAAWVECFSD